MEHLFLDYGRKVISDWPGIGTVFVEIGIDCKGLDPVLIPCNSNERRVCIKFILRVDKGPSRIEHLFLG